MTLGVPKTQDRALRMRRLAGTLLFSALILGATAGLLAFIVVDATVRLPVTLVSAGAGILVWFVLSRPRVAAKRVSANVGFAAMVLSIFVVTAFGSAPDIVWVVFLAFTVGMLIPTICRVLAREWSRSEPPLRDPSA